MHRFACFSSVLLFVFIYFVAPPAHSATLPNSPKFSDSISVAGEVDQHTFSASAGDTIYLRVADTGNSQLTPDLTFVDPDGVVLRVNSGSLVAHIDARQLVKSGTYTVFVADASSSGNASGPYDIYYANAPDANDDGVLPNGEMLSGMIDLGDLDTYTFSGAAGETVFIWLADKETTEFINSGFTPNVTLI